MAPRSEPLPQLVRRPGPLRVWLWPRRPHPCPRGPPGPHPRDHCWACSPLGLPPRCPQQLPRLSGRPGSQPEGGQEAPSPSPCRDAARGLLAHPGPPPPPAPGHTGLPCPHRPHGGRVPCTASLGSRPRPRPRWPQPGAPAAERGPECVVKRPGSQVLPRPLSSVQRPSQTLCSTSAGSLPILSAQVRGTQSVTWSCDRHAGRSRASRLPRGHAAPFAHPPCPTPAPPPHLLSVALAPPGASWAWAPAGLALRVCLVSGAQRPRGPPALQPVSPRPSFLGHG